MPNVNERELVLADNEQALIQDTTKGSVIVYVGPYKASLSETDRPVHYDTRTGGFEQCSLQESKQRFIQADESSYVVLQNPINDENTKLPTKGNNTPEELRIGRKINIPGPVQFPLWPGQSAQVIKGHQLRTNQYLIARVYNDKMAEENWEKTILKTEGSEDDSKTKKAKESVNQVLDRPKSFAIGTLFIVPGDRVSYYVPPTGIEVLPDDQGNYVREAVTLERLEYCVLLDESGDKRFVTGPKVVFPKPTEAFVNEGDSNVFRALELNHLMGLHIKVIADYKEGDKEYKTGQELFIKGESETQTTVYYPRAEHAIIRYGNQQIYYAVTIPKGEARYVLNRTTGEISLVKGPKMFLPDPRKEVIVKRILSPKLVELLYPGNVEASQYNTALEGQVKAKYGENAPDYMDALESMGGMESSSEIKRCFAVAADAPITASSMSYMPSPRVAGPKAKASFVGAGMSRRTTYTEPRTLTLDSKYQGAVAINIWNGYAVMIVDRSGNRRVEIGPKTVLLEYDEVPEVMELSTGKPKTTDKLLNTAYLRIRANKISDIVEVETSDYVRVQVKLSYRVNFEGDDPTLWFECENYVKFLCDHMRSLLKNRVHRLGIREFHENATDIIRDIVLGESTDNGRVGKLFQENNMRIYDVEVLQVTIGDSIIANLLIQEQHKTVQEEIDLQNKRRELAITKEREAIAAEIIEIKEVTKAKQHQVSVTELERSHLLEKQKKHQETTLKKNEVEFEKSLQALYDEIQKAELARDKATNEQELAEAQAEVELRIKEANAEAEALRKKAEAVSPHLVAALQQFSDAHVLSNLSEAVSPIAMLQKTGIMETLGQLFDGSAIGHGAISGATQAGLLRRAEMAKSNGSKEKS